MNLTDLAHEITPSSTILLLGAGASAGSGAPVGTGLAKHLGSKLRPISDSDDLAEVSGIFERKNGRTALAEAVRDVFADLQPAGGMLALPAFDWSAIYSTNFDRLVESAFQLAARDLHVVRSNFDFTKRKDPESCSLYKIHGCITVDSGFGHQSKMLLTEDDYEEFEQYRQSLFSSLKFEMLTKDTLIVGQSLRDRHLRDLCRQVAALRDQGASGRIFLLAFDYDSDRADLYEQRGITVVAGGLDDLCHALAHETKPVPTVVYSSKSANSLPTLLVSATVDVSHASTLQSNSIRLFNGGPATYADIKAGLTINRAIENRLTDWQKGSRGFFTVLTGAGGVGKTTLARALLLKRREEGFSCWEHRNEFALDSDLWLDVEASLRRTSRQGVLLVDDCAQHMKSLNKLVEGLGSIDRPHLRIVATVNAAQWRSKAKSAYFFSRGSTERLSELTDGDLKALVNLVDREPSIRALVEQGFRRLSRPEQIRRLRERCSADMFVCLKNIFHNESLDNILLQEFAALSEEAQDVYRLVAALQAMGAKVHRQMVVRLLGVEANTLSSLLDQLEDVVAEYDVDPKQGLYGWSTRHDVVAQVVATYKFADQDELQAILNRFIDSLNPTIYLERETARSIASNDMGIARIASIEDQSALLQRLIETVPGERTPRRRLIRLYLRNGLLAEAELAIKLAGHAVGQDPIIDRYKCILAIRRAEDTTGLLDEDRRAMLLEAERLARRCVDRNPDDKFNFRVLGDVGRALAIRFGTTTVLESTIEAMRERESFVLDPAFMDERRTIEETLRKIVREASARMSDVDVSHTSSDDSILEDSDG